MASGTSRYLVLPGYGGSGPLHWQTLWEADPAYRRVDLGDWEEPRREAWVARLEQAVGENASGGNVILVAHSLACLLVAHWAAWAASTDKAGTAGTESLRAVKAAFLVAPPDPAGPEFPSTASGFSPIPLLRLPFPALVVASSDDPYATLAFSRSCSAAWGVPLAEIGARGHINASSNLGDWPEGRALLSRLAGK